MTRWETFVTNISDPANAALLIAIIAFDALVIFALWRLGAFKWK